MADYRRTEFVSIEPVFAEIREDLNSYFASGEMDDLLFPKWASFALKKLTKTSLPIKEAALYIKNYKAYLPEDFDSVRELWACNTTYSNPYPNPTSYYYQVDCRIERTEGSGCDACPQDVPKEDCCPEPCDATVDYTVTHKETGVRIFMYNLTYLLRPGTISTKKLCGEGCPNIHSEFPDIFDIHGSELATNFREGNVHLIYYSKNEDPDGNLLINDNPYIQDYVIKFIKYKLFSKLLENSATPETFNQVRYKKENAEQAMNEALIIAQTDAKKDTLQKIRERSIRNRIRFSNYSRGLR